MTARRILSLCVAALCLASVFVAAPALGAPDDDPLPEIRDAWRWSSFREDAGLPARHVLDVVEARDGTIWAATVAGLAWYDGFVWHSPGSGGPESTGRVTRLVADPSDGVVALVDTQAFRCSRGSSTLIDTDANSVTWIGTVGDRVVLSGGQAVEALIAGTARTEPFTQLAPDVAVQRAWGARSKRVLLTSSDGLFALGDGEERLLRPPTDAGVYVGFAVEFSDGEGFASVESPMSARGLWTWKPGRPAFHLNPSLPIPARAMDLAPDGTVLVVFDSGTLGVRLPGEEKWHHLVPPAELQGVTTLRFDSAGDLWVGTMSGLNHLRLSDQRWTRWRLPAPDERNAIESLSLGDDGTIWAGTPAGALAFAPDGGVRHVDRIGDTLVRDVTALAHDSEGRVWIGSGSAFTGAFRLDGSEWRHFGREDGLLAGRVHAIRRLPDGSLWLLGIGPGQDDGPGAFRLGVDGQFECVKPPGGLGFGRVYDLIAGPGGALWFGTRGGIARLRDGAWTTWPHDALDGLREAFALTLAPDGTLWFGDRRNGIGSLAPDGSIRRHASPGGLVVRRVWGLTTDASGGVWAATEGGLGLFRDGSWSAVGSEHGLPAARCWPIVATQDRIYVGTNGHGVFALSLPGRAGRPPQVRVSPPVVDGRTAWVRWRADSFGGTVASDRIPTRHRLDDGPWAPWGVGRETALHRLGAGDHVVEVQAKGLFGDVADSVSSVAFQIEPALHRRPIFVVPLGLLAAALLGLLVHTGLRRGAHQRALRDSEHRLREILDNANDIVFTHDMSGRFLSLNPAGEARAGVKLADNPGLCVSDLLPSEGLAAAGKAMARLREEGGSVTYEAELMTRSAERRSIEVSVRLLYDQGRPARVLGIARDVTERKRIESELRQAQKMEAVGKLTGGVAHDFNNILAAIMVALDLLHLQLGPDHESVGLVNESLAAAERGARLTQQLLTFSRRQGLAPEPVLLPELVDQLADILRRALGTPVSVDVEHAPGPWYCDADGAQLQNVILNLALNARDAMPNGGTLTVRTGTTTVVQGDPSAPADVEPGDYVTLRVEDTGTGMEPDVASRAFEPFFTTKEVGRGTGLGLSMVYGFVKQSGGHVRLESRPGAGTIVDVLLPRSAHAPPADRAAPVEAPRGKGERVLVIEDHDELRELFAAMLTGLDYDVVTTANGPAAVDVLATDEGIDVVLCDVMLPGGLSGPDAVRKARAARPGLRVLFTSGQSGPALAGHGMDEHERHFLAKPFRVEDLARALRAVLER